MMMMEYSIKGKIRKTYLIQNMINSDIKNPNIESIGCFTVYTQSYQSAPLLRK